MAWTKTTNLSGPTAVSADAGNTATLGSDGLLYARPELIVARAGSEPSPLDVPDGTLLVVVD